MNSHPQQPLQSYPDHLRIHRTITFLIPFFFILHNLIYLVQSTQIIYNPGPHGTYYCSGLEDCYFNCSNSDCSQSTLYFTDHSNHYDLTINCTADFIFDGLCALHTKNVLYTCICITHEFATALFGFLRSPVYTYVLCTFSRINTSVPCLSRGTSIERGDLNFI